MYCRYIFSGMLFRSDNLYFCIRMLQKEPEQFTTGIPGSTGNPNFNQALNTLICLEP